MEGADKKLSSKGHLMSLTTKHPYKMIGSVFCDKCKKDIVIAEGFYHCVIENEDFHKHCLDDQPAQQQAPVEKTEKVLHPLNGKKIIITSNGCVDFEQCCTLLVFCNKLGA